MWTHVSALSEAASQIGRLRPTANVPGSNEPGFRSSSGADVGQARNGQARIIVIVGVAVTMMFIAIPMVIVGPSLAGQHNLYLRGKPSDATVQSIINRSGKSGGEFISYHYRFGGRDFGGVDARPGTIQTISQGDTIPILVDPVDPSKSEINIHNLGKHVDPYVGAIRTAAPLGALLAIFAGYLTFTFLRNRERS